MSFEGANRVVNVQQLSCVLTVMDAQRKFLFQLFVVLGTYSTCLAVAQQNTAIVDQKVYEFPTYEQAVQTTSVAKETDKVSYETSVRDNRFEFTKLKYLSDGLKVVGYLYKPKEINGRKFPVIIFNRPSAIRGDVAPELISTFHRFASEGFVVFAPLLRQSDGSEGKDEIGGADVDDVMNSLLVLRSLPYVDIENSFMYGESRGGMMTYQAIKKGFPVRAAAVVGAFTDLRELIETHPQQYPLAMLTQIWPNYETSKMEIIQQRSATNWPELLNSPLLIMHGGKDSDVNPEQSLRLAQQLQKLGRVYELIIYANDNHLVTENREDRIRRTVGWFKKFIK